MWGFLLDPLNVFIPFSWRIPTHYQHFRLFVAMKMTLNVISTETRKAEPQSIDVAYLNFYSLTAWHILFLYNDAEHAFFSLSSYGLFGCYLVLSYDCVWVYAIFEILFFFCSNVTNCLFVRFKAGTEQKSRIERFCRSCLYGPQWTVHWLASR